MGRIWFVAAALTCATALGAGADRSPGAGPWDLAELQKTPRVEIAETKEVDEGGTRVALSSLYYAGEPWRVSRRASSPTTPVPAVGPEKNFPAMVLVHGGGGTAFREWARLWAARGYVALAMDLAGHGPERKRLPDGGPDQDDDAKFRAPDRTGSRTPGPITRSPR